MTVPNDRVRELIACFPNFDVGKCLRELLLARAVVRAAPTLAQSCVDDDYAPAGLVETIDALREMNAGQGGEVLP